MERADARTSLEVAARETRAERVYNIFDKKIYFSRLAVVGVLHQQHFSAIENHLQKNKCQMETPDILKILVITCW